MESHAAVPRRTPPPVPPKTSPLRAGTGGKVLLTPPSSRGAPAPTPATAGASPLPPPPRSAPRGEWNQTMDVQRQKLQLESPRKDEALSEVLQAPHQRRVADAEVPQPRADVVADNHRSHRLGGAGPSAAPGGPVRKVHNPLPTHAPLPVLQPSGMSSSCGGSTVPRPAGVGQQVAPQQPLVAVGGTATSTAAAAVQGDPGQRPMAQQRQQQLPPASPLASAAPRLQVSVVVKGTSHDHRVAVPPPRVMEISLHSTTVTVREVVEQCLSMVTSLCAAGVVVSSAVLEQRGQPLPDASTLLSVSDAVELYFLSVDYVSQQPLSGRSPARPGPTTPMHPPSPGVASPPSAVVDAPPAALLRSLEHRLSAVESFVRSHSEQRSDSDDRHPGGDAMDREAFSYGAAPNASDGRRKQLPVKYATPPHFEDPSARLDDAVPTVQSMPAVSPIDGGQRRHDLRGRDDVSCMSPRTDFDAGGGGASDRRVPTGTKGTYAIQAEKLEYLALTSRQERLERLDQIKRLIADKVDLYQWMTDVLDTPRHTVEYNGHARLPASFGSERHGLSAAGERQKMAPAAFATPRELQTPRAVDHDNVHVDYDPVLDIWKLRKGPPV